jgi:hypothetical protein
MTTDKIYFRVSEKIKPLTRFSPSISPQESFHIQYFFHTPFQYDSLENYKPVPDTDIAFYIDIEVYNSSNDTLYLNEQNYTLYPHGATVFLTYHMDIIIQHSQKDIFKTSRSVTGPFKSELLYMSNFIIPKFIDTLYIQNTKIHFEIKPLFHVLDTQDVLVEYEILETENNVPNTNNQEIKSSASLISKDTNKNVDEQENDIYELNIKGYGNIVFHKEMVNSTINISLVDTNENYKNSNKGGEQYSGGSNKGGEQYNHSNKGSEEYTGGSNKGGEQYNHSNKGSKQYTDLNEEIDMENSNHSSINVRNIE